MKLVLDITTEQQKQNIIQLAQRLQVSIEVLELTEDEDAAAMVRAIDAGIKNDILSPAETDEFLSHLGKVTLNIGFINRILKAIRLYPIYK